jgi:hypothetical protein
MKFKEFFSISAYCRIDDNNLRCLCSHFRIVCILCYVLSCFARDVPPDSAARAIVVFAA